MKVRAIENASTQEIIWTAAAAIGVLLRFFSVHIAWKDVKKSRLLRNGLHQESLWLIADATLKTECAGFAIKLFFMGMGIYAMTVPKNPNKGVEGYQWYIAVGIVTIICIMNITSFANARVRKRVREIELGKQ